MKRRSGYGRQLAERGILRQRGRKERGGEAADAGGLLIAFTTACP